MFVEYELREDAEKLVQAKIPQIQRCRHPQGVEVSMTCHMTIWLARLPTSDSDVFSECGCFSDHMPTGHVGHPLTGPGNHSELPDVSTLQVTDSPGAGFLWLNWNRSVMTTGVGSKWAFKNLPQLDKLLFRGATRLLNRPKDLAPIALRNAATSRFSGISGAMKNISTHSI